MFAKISLVVFSFSFVIFEVFCKCGIDKNVCDTVRCAYVNESSCPTGYTFISADPKNCVCCNYCECVPEMCHAADCRPINKCETGRELIKANYSKCNCCDKCQKTTNIKYCDNVKCPSSINCPSGYTLVQPDPNNGNCCSHCVCKPETCPATSCLRIDSCAKGKYLKRADFSKCICCDFCVDYCT